MVVVGVMVVVGLGVSFGFAYEIEESVFFVGYG